MMDRWKVVVKGMHSQQSDVILMQGPRGQQGQLPATALLPAPPGLTCADERDKPLLCVLEVISYACIEDRSTRVSMLEFLMLVHGLPGLIGHRPVTNVGL